MLSKIELRKYRDHTLSVTSSKGWYREPLLRTHGFCWAAALKSKPNTVHPAALVAALEKLNLGTDRILAPHSSLYLYRPLN